MASNSSEVCALLYELARTHNGRNIEVALNDVPVLIIQRFEEADRVLRLNAANYNKNMAWLRQVIGASRFSENGAAWELRRDLSQVYFNKFDREQTFRLAMRYAQDTLANMIERSATGLTTIDDRALRELTANVVVENFLDVRLADTEIDLDLMAELMEYGSEYSFVPAGKTGTLYRKRLETLIGLRRSALKSLRGFRSADMPMTPMLAGMIAADSNSDNDFVLEQELIAFLAAGAETSAATLGWVCYMLAKHPDLQEQLREVTTTFWKTDACDWAHLSELTPLSNFVSETLRLFPPTPIIARLALGDDRLGEHAVKAGQNVLISFVGLQHDARLRSDPWNFDIEVSPTKPGSGTHSAFSFGPRVCGGKHFAMVELITFLAVFLRDAEFELTSDAPPVFHWKSQMLRAGGQPVRMRRLVRQ